MIIFGISVSMIVFWLALALIFLLIEAATAGLTTIWFIALLTALFDAPVALQVIIFFVVSICLLVFTRKIFVEKLKTGSEKTNVDALIGTKGIVVQPIRPFAVGQVKVNGQVWSAVGKTPETDIEQGREVKVHAIEGVKLVVTPTRQD